MTISAFPYWVAGEYNFGESGMTLRDYFAAKIVAELISGFVWGSEVFASEESISLYSYRIADAMMKAREVK